MRTPITRELLSRMPQGFVVYDTPGMLGSSLVYSHTNGEKEDLYFSGSTFGYSKNVEGYVSFCLHEALSPFYLPNEGEYGYEENKMLEVEAT